MIKLEEKVETLIEALPYINKFYGKTIVIKYGGNAMVNEELKELVTQDIIFMKHIGIKPVIVHGGGPAIDKMLKKFGKKSKFKNGNRVTDKETMDIVEMVLAGKINKEIVAKINKYGGKAVGISGKDANLVIAEKKYIRDNGENIDLGYVGKIKKINPKIINILGNEGYIPIISPIGIDSDGNSYNINADYVAGEIAGALKADKLIFMTDVKGILKEIKDKTTLISKLKISEIHELIENGILKGGMLPKIEACTTAIKKGSESAHIIDGTVKHAMLLEVFTNDGIGTMIVQ